MALLNSLKYCVADKIACSNFFGCPLGYHDTFRFYDLVNMKINKNRLLLALLPALLAGCTTQNSPFYWQQECDSAFRGTARI